MNILQKRINYKFGDTIKIKPILDVHYGVKACDEKAFKKGMFETDEHTYFIAVGDLLDSVHAKDPRYRKSNDIFTGDDVIDQQVNGMIKMLEPYKERIIGIGSGNHEDEIAKRCGTNPTNRMCNKLGVPRLGYSGLIKLILSENGARGRTVIIRYHHGWGGGSRTQGADLTKFSKDMLYWDADIFLFGHVHRKQVDEVPRLGLSGLKLIAKPQLLCICGTYLKTYVEGEDPTYSERNGYPPISVGGVTIEIKPDERWVKLKAYVD